jgi:hypothetical protein
VKVSKNKNNKIDYHKIGNSDDAIYMLTLSSDAVIEMKTVV